MATGIIFDKRKGGMADNEVFRLLGGLSNYSSSRSCANRCPSGCTIWYLTTYLAAKSMGFVQPRRRHQGFEVLRSGLRSLESCVNLDRQTVRNKTAEYRNGRNLGPEQGRNLITNANSNWITLGTKFSQLVFLCISQASFNLLIDYYYYYYYYYFVFRSRQS